MKVVYIADDGKQFDDEFACIDYEWIQKHKNLQSVKFYDYDNHMLTDIFNEDVYGATTKVVVPDEDAVEDLQEFGEYTGFCSYEDITEPGEWHWDEDEMGFVKRK